MQHPSCDRGGASSGDATGCALRADCGDGAYDQFGGAVRRDLSQLMPHSGIGEAGHQSLTVRRDVWRWQSQVAARLVPERLDPRSAAGIGYRFVDCLIATDAACVRKQRMRAVEQPEFSLLKRPDISYQRGA